MTAQDGAFPRAEVVVDLAAVRHNVGLLAERANRSGARTMVVVKADGYGHGAVRVARAAVAAGATWIGVCHLEEALALRRAGVTARVLSWLHVPDEDFAPAIAADVDLSVSSLRALAAVLAAARSVGRRVRLHLKADTGLSRNGCPPEHWPELVAAAAAAQAAGEAEVVAVWSHLASADEPGDPSVDQQARRFAAAYETARAAGLRPMRHLANSAALLTRPDLHFDLVRAGVAAYGLNPVPWAGDVDLRPAMTFRARVAYVKRVPAGEAVSYGGTWVAPRDTTLALVPAGYADGVPRALSGRMEVWLAGRRRPVVGRVCMDQVMVDCGDDVVVEGEEAVLFGPGDRGEPTAQEWADAVGTIHYEIVTGMARPRVVRTTKNDTADTADAGGRADTDGGQGNGRLTPSGVGS
ncbi:alanine racemase [Streptoalloteichus hindustanus]|uniref:Alanine racemase n=1 Tax=Streptoalloteichus hindustanus TaxID=2017 RepID=A0A1M4TBI7_STRHI|nr:alanine racemase [Streptoalloteichus hindustanus]SHE41765.1 alanine racemase [Streptoalloteichus hindustanus]